MKVRRSAAALFFAVYAQAQTPAHTPWHISRVVELKEENRRGLPDGSGAFLAAAPAGYNAVVEHMSARCVAPPSISIIYAEVIANASATNPGQSGQAGPAGQEDSANHPLLLVTSYSGGLNVYLASQAVKIRLGGGSGGLRLNLLVIKDTDEVASYSCLVSLSGYTEKQ